MNEYQHRRHNKSLLMAHIIFVPKYSTYLAWKHHGAFLRKIYWSGKFLWFAGYFAASIGQVSQATIEHYIENQG